MKEEVERGRLKVWGEFEMRRLIKQQRVWGGKADTERLKHSKGEQVKRNNKIKLLKATESKRRYRKKGEENIRLGKWEQKRKREKNRRKHKKINISIKGVVIRC